MSGAILFLLGFSSVVGIYEIAVLGRKTKTDKFTKSIDKLGKMK